MKGARGMSPAQGAAARDAIREAIRTIDRAVTKGIIHRNTAARRKSALARRLLLVK